jgi:peptide/nickel transport system substrate-binding protein
MPNQPNHTAKVKKLRNSKAIGRMAIVGIVIVIIAVAGVVGYYLTIPTTPAIKDTLVWGTTDSVETNLDPAHAYDYFGWTIIRSLGAGLVDYAPGATGASDIIADLATSWSVSSDGLQWTFTLRQGVEYDDGTEFNATHVKYTFDRGIGMADPNGAYVGIGFGDIIQNVTVVDSHTVRFYLPIPCPFFLTLIAGQECVMVDPTYAPMHGSSWNATDTVNYAEGNPRTSNPMGLGPYTLANWTRTAGKDQAMKLVANPNYWNASAGMPKTKNIIIQFYQSSSTLTLAIENGEVDIAFRQLAVTDIKTMQSNTNLHVWLGTGNFIQYLAMQERYWPFNETKIRQAVGAAINRTMIVSTVFQGQGQNLYTMVPIGMSYHKDVFQNLGDPNYTRTQELLASYGFNATHKLTFDVYYETSGHYPQSSQVAQVLKASIEASGVITVNLQSLEWAAMSSARKGGTMPAFIYGWYPDYIDTDDYTWVFMQTSGQTWLNLNYSNPEMDQLLGWARGNTTDSVRNTLYGQIQDLSVIDCPEIPIYQGSAYAVSSLKVKGVYLDITQNFRPWLLYAEQ